MILQGGPVEIAEAERNQAPARHREILSRDGGADRQERLDERRLHAREARYRCKERQAEAQILQHVAMLHKNEALGPIAGIRELVMRVARIHPGFAVLRIMVGKGEMRPAIAKRL